MKAMRILIDLLKKPDINEGLDRFHSESGAILLDVRTKEEFENGHIPGAVNIPLDQITKAKERIQNPKTPVFVYCLRGARSRKATASLKQMGYENAISIGGINRYKGKCV